MNEVLPLTKEPTNKETTKTSKRTIMINVGIYCVTYNSYRETYNFVDSVMAAVHEASGLARVSIFIADNTDSESQELSFGISSDVEIQVFPYHENHGYLGAVRRMMESASPTDFDYVIISNVDVTFDAPFLRILVSRTFANDVGWIAPCISSGIKAQDHNPHLINRYPKIKLHILRLFFRFPFLYHLYTHTICRIKHHKKYEAGVYYAGYGATMILTKNFFARNGLINYSAFLFCEELCLAEQCRVNGLKVLYDPALKIFDEEHVSTSKLNFRIFCRYNYDAISYVLKTYY